ncbi:MAG: hypothetical protein ACR2QU_02820 [Gammaproteobacteria bacterium]
MLGSRAQLAELVPVLKIAEETGLSYSVWFTGQDREPVDDLVADLGIAPKFVSVDNPGKGSGIGSLFLWMPLTLNDCFRYVHSVKLWTTRRPMVVVCGRELLAWVGAVAGRWGGGDIVHLESRPSSDKPFPGGLLRRQIFRKARYAICSSEATAREMAGYSGCIVVNTEASPHAAIEALTRWAS